MIVTYASGVLGISVRQRVSVAGGEDKVAG